MEGDVLILVLVEDGLRDSTKWKIHSRFRVVLILVLVEDGLRKYLDEFAQNDVHLS